MNRNMFLSAQVPHRKISIFPLKWPMMLCLCFGLATLTGCGPSEDEPVKVKERTSPNSYTFGDVIKFGAGRGSERFRREGWSDTEKDFTWTTGQSARLVLAIPPGVAHALNLRMRLAAFTKAPELPSQPVELYVNGERLADWTVGEKAEFTATIPSNILGAGGELTIEIKTPKAASPKSLNVSADPRVLGVSCSELVITKE